MNKVKAYTWREGEIIMFFKMEYKYINKILEKIWKMYRIRDEVIENKDVKLNYKYINFQPNLKAVCQDEI